MASKAELALILSLVDEVSKTAKGIKGELLDVGKTGQGLQGTLRDVGSGLASLGTTAIIGGIGLATAAVTSLGAACAKLAVDALPLQGIRDSFQGITDDADATLAALRKGSLGMVRDAELMKSYNQAAQLVGQTFADQLPDAMGYLSKVAAATGQDMGYMMDSLVKGVGRLSPMILDNLGIQVQLSDATARAAEMFGVEEKALTKAQQQAGMMDVVLEKLAENTADMPEVAGTAAQQWAALGVTMQNFKDDIGLALVPVLQKLLEPLGKLVADHGPRLASLFEARVVPVLDKAATIVGIFFDRLGEGASPLDAFRTALSLMVPPDTMVRIGEIICTVQGLAATISAFVGEHAEELKAALIAIGAVLAGAAIVSGIMGIVGAITALANPVTLVIAAVGLLAAAWAGNWGGIQDKTKAVIEWITPYIQGALADIQGWWAEHGAQVIGAIMALWEGVKTAFNNAVQWIKDLIALFQLAQVGEWYEFGAKLRQIVDELWSKIKVAFSAAKEWLVDIIKDLLKAITSRFTEIDWLQLGRDIINGIANGIRGAAGFLADAARNAARAALDAAKGFLGIHSPSSVAAEMIGVPFVEGIGAGIDRAMGQLAQTQLANLSARMATVPAVGGAAHVGGSSTSIDYDRLGAAVAQAMRAHPTYQISANYRYQDERELRDDLRLLQMLGAAT